MDSDDVKAAADRLRGCVGATHDFDNAPLGFIEDAWLLAQAYLALGEQRYKPHYLIEGTCPTSGELRLTSGYTSAAQAKAVSYDLDWRDIKIKRVVRFEQEVQE